MLAFLRRTCTPAQVAAVGARPDADFDDCHSLVAQWRFAVFEALGAPSDAATYASVLPAVQRVGAGKNAKTQTWAQYARAARLLERVALGADAWDPAAVVNATTLNTSAVELAGALARAVPQSSELWLALNAVSNEQQFIAVVSSDKPEIRTQALNLSLIHI